MDINVSVAKIFDSMEYGPIVDGVSLAKAWLESKSKRLLSVVNGESIVGVGQSNSFKVNDFHSSQLLAEVVEATADQVELAVKSSVSAFEHWNGLKPYVRARHLYNIARRVQQHASLLAQMESCVRGVQFRDPKECDVPSVIRTLYHNAGWAQLLHSEFDGWVARGVVVGIMSRVTPLQALGWIVVPALAAGCTVVLKPSRQAAPVALLLAEMCLEAGLPAGVLNVVTGGWDIGKALAMHPHVDKVTFFGSTAVGRTVRQQIAELGRSHTLLLSGRTPMIVLESADLDAACDAVIESAWFNQGQVPWAVTDLFVQQSVFKVFLLKLQARIEKLRVGHNLDKMADVGYTCKRETSEAVRAWIDRNRSCGAQVLTIPEEAQLNPPGTYLTPAAVVSGIAEASPSTVLQEDCWPRPGIEVSAFRTAKEAVGLANGSRYSVAASVWAQDGSLAQEVAQSLQVGIVWINCINKFDASVTWGPRRHSGVGRLGGREGVLEYLKPIVPPLRSAAAPGVNGRKGTSPLTAPDIGRVDRTFKLYIGGAHVRPDGNNSTVICDHDGQPYAMVPQATRKDIRNAVEAAHKAQPGWNKSGAHSRAQVLFYFAENLALRKTEFAQELSRLLGLPEDAAVEEVDRSVECLFFWASACDKCPLGTPPLVHHEPRGVIGIVCPPKPAALLALLSLLAPAIALGNAVVLVPHESCPLPALWLGQVAATSDLPSGLLNVVSGNAESLGAVLASHHDVNCLWCPAGVSGASVYQSCACSSMMSIWCFEEGSLCGRHHHQHHVEFFLNATLTKAIWAPAGGMFGN